MSDKRKRESERAKTRAATGKRKRPIAAAKAEHERRVKEHFATKKIRAAVRAHREALADLQDARREGGVVGEELLERVGKARLAAAYTAMPPLAEADGIAFEASWEMQAINAANKHALESLAALEQTYSAALEKTSYDDLKNLLPVKVKQVARLHAGARKIFHVFDVLSQLARSFHTPADDGDETDKLDPPKGKAPDFEIAEMVPAEQAIFVPEPETKKKGRPPSRRGLQDAVAAAMDELGDVFSPAEFVEHRNAALGAKNPNRLLRSEVDEAKKAVLERKRTQGKPPV